jgi:hypothetical protein
MAVFIKRYSFPSAELIKHYAMKAYGGVDVKILVLPFAYYDLFWINAAENRNC